MWDIFTDLKPLLAACVGLLAEQPLFMVLTAYSIRASFYSLDELMAECLAGLGRIDEARDAFTRTAATANDLGLYSEEFDVADGRALGNFPQALTHLSHVVAAVAISEAERGGIDEPTLG